MNKFIRLVVSGLTLCGALATVPGIAEAREVGRSAPAHWSAALPAGTTAAGARASVPGAGSFARRAS